VRQEHALFDDQPVELVVPHRQAGLETELGQVTGAARVGGIAGALEPTHLEMPPVGAAHLLGEMAEHHDAAERPRQRRVEQTVGARREEAARRAGGIAAQPVRDEPLARHEAVGPACVSWWPRDPPDRFTETHDDYAVRRFGPYGRGRQAPGASTIADS